MRRVALIILGIAAGLTALILLAVAIAVATFDLRTLVAPVQARVKAATGRDLAINGPIDLKVSLEPRIVVSDVSLGNAPWGKAPDMVHARRVEVRVALLPLMSRRFEVVELALVEPVIALETDAQGRGNWDFGLTPAAPVSQPAGAAATALAGAGAFGIANLSVDNGALTYRDGVTGQTTHVTIERLSARSRGGDAPVEAEFRGKVNDIAVALAGNLGPVDALRAGRWPYPVAAKGEIGGKSAKVSTKFGMEGDVVKLDDIDFALGAFAAKGQATVTAKGGRRTYAFNLAIPAIALSDLPIPVASGGATGAAKPAPSRMIFSEATWSLDALQNVDAEGRVSIAGLALDKGVKLTDVSATLALREGKLDVTEIRSRLFDGTLRGHLSLDTKRAPPALTMKMDGENLSLAPILEAVGTRREIRGGRTTLAIDVAARGASPHAWAASTSGIVVATVGQTTLVNTKLDLDNSIDRLVQAVNPFRERDPSTELKCAVIRLPLTDGIAQIDRSIAFETQKLRVSASGTIDFKTETLDLALRPRIKEGIPLDIPQFSDLVRFSGPFAHPGVSIDAVAGAMALAKIGAAIGTSGLSIVGTSLLQQATDGGDVCAVALGRAPAERSRAEKPSAHQKAPQQPADGIGKALGKLFSR
jgi:AsmA family protein